MKATRWLMLLIAVVGSLVILACGTAADAEPQGVAGVTTQDPSPQSIDVVVPFTEIVPIGGRRGTGNFPSRPDPGRQRHRCRV